MPVRKEIEGKETSEFAVTFSSSSFNRVSARLCYCIVANKSELVFLHVPFVLSAPSLSPTTSCNQKTMLSDMLQGGQNVFRSTPICP